MFGRVKFKLIIQIILSRNIFREIVAVKIEIFVSAAVFFVAAMPISNGGGYGLKRFFAYGSLGFAYSQS